MKKLLLITTALAVGLAGPAHADPISAAVAWVGSTFAVSAAAATLIVNFAVSTALTAISSALYKPKLPGQNVSFDVKMGDDTPLSFVAGKFATAGKRKYIGSWGPNTRDIVEVIEISAMPQAFGRFWVNDELGIIDTTRTEVRRGQNVGWPVENNASGPGDSNIWVKWYDGSQIAADPYLVSVFGSDEDYPWTNAMVGRGKTYAVVTSCYHAEDQTTYPTFLWEPAPLPLYDWRRDSTNGGNGAQRWGDRSTYQPTLNPAVISYNVVRGIYYGTEWVFGGKNLPAWRLPVAEWSAAANACDQDMNLSAGGVQPRYQCGLEISVDMEPASVLDELGKSANMKFAEVGGRLKPIVDLPGAAVFAFTDGDILITKGQSFSPFYSASDTFNAISATYPEPGEKWTSKDAPEYVDAEAREDDGGQHLPTSMSYGAVPFGNQVQRLMRSQMRDFRRMRRHQFYLPPDAYALEPGIDMVSWTSERNGYVNKQFTVESVSKTPGMNVLVSLREVDPSDYDWSSDFERPIVITPPVNPRPFVQTSNGFTVAPAVIVDEESNTRRPDVLASYVGDEVGITNIQIRARVLGREELVIDTLRRWNTGQTWRSFNVLPATAYEFQALLFSDLTSRGQWSPWVQVTTPDVGFSWEDWDAELREEIQRDLAKADQAAEDAKEALRLADAAQAYADQQDAILRESLEEANAEISSVRGDLLARAADLAARIVSEAARADAYTDTELYDFNVVVQGQFDAVAGQISELTAALTSDNLIANGAFANGLSGWEGTAVAILDRQGSANALVLAAPDLQMAQVGDNATGQLRQSLASFDVTSDDRLQLRFAAAATALRSVTITVQWLDVSGAVMSTASRSVTVSPANQWKVYSEQFEPPVGARGANLTLGKTQTGVPLLVTAVSASTINVAIAAQIAELSAAQVTLESSLATLQSSIDTRFSDANIRITNETTARTSALGAMGVRVGTVETRSSDNAGRLSTAETSLSNAQGSIVQLRQDLTAEGTAWRGGVTEERTARQTETGALAGRATRVEASVGQGDSVINDTLLSSSGWTRWGSQGSLLLLPGSVYPLGRDWRFSITSPSTQDGMQLSQSPASIWTGQLNADAYVMEIDFTLVSGSISGAGVNFRWTNTTGASFNTLIPLSAMQAGPRVNNGTTQTARAVFKRPSGFSGTFASHTVFVHANDTPAWTGGGANKVIIFHRIRIRPATAEELGRGAVEEGIKANVLSDYLTSAQTTQAIASLQESLTASLGGNLAAVRRSATAIADLSGSVARFTQIATVDGGRQAAGIEVVSFNNAGGASGSLVKLIGDNVVVPGTLSTSRLVVSDMSNLFSDPNLETVGLPGVWAKWDGGNFTADTYSSTFGGYETDKVLRIRSGAQLANNQCRFVFKPEGIMVTPGRRYYASCLIGATGGPTRNNTRGIFRIYFYGRNADGGLVYSRSQAVGDYGGGTQKFDMEFTPAANENAILIAFQVAANTGTTDQDIVFNNPVVTGMTGSVLIEDGAVIARHVTADTVRALNGRFSSLQAANVRIGEAEIDTLQLAGNSVIVPISAVGSTVSGGSSGLVQILSLTVNLPANTPAVILWSIEHNYVGAGGERGWDFSLRRNGSIISERTNMTLGNDWPAGIFMDNLGTAGNRVYTVWWKGANNGIQARARLVILGVKR